MTSKLKCPVCKEETISDFCLMCDKIDKGYTSGRQIYKCNKCSLFGNKELWQALIQAKQDLEIARKALDWLAHNHLASNFVRVEQLRQYASNALEQINRKED